MARALIVGCGCRGRIFGQRLAAEGWAVRGTSRAAAGLRAIEAAGFEAARADPGRPGTVLELVADVAVIHWLLGSARGEPGMLAAIHGDRLERLLEKLVDTPLRGFVYERGGDVAFEHRAGGAQIVERAASTWRLPVRLVDADPGDVEGWLAEMLAATRQLVA